VSDEERVSFRLNDLRDGESSHSVAQNGMPASDASMERAFEQARAAAEPESLSSLNSLDSWLGRPSKNERLELNSVDVELAKATVKLRARDLDVRLKRLLALFAIGAVSVQLAVADYYFVSNALVGDEPPSDTVLVAWLSSTVVEVIGIVLIVARNLFPNKGKGRESGKVEATASD
jgi:hypothetical protein